VLRGRSSQAAKADVWFDSVSQRLKLSRAVIVHRGPADGFHNGQIAAALGIARHAIDELIESVMTRPARRYALGDGLEMPKVLRGEVFVQEAVGPANTLLALARVRYFDAMAALRRTLVVGKPSSGCDWPGFPQPAAAPVFWTVG
jgi:hypothetical protein